MRSKESDATKAPATEGVLLESGRARNPFPQVAIKAFPNRKVRLMMDRGFRGSMMVSNTIYGVGSSPSLRGGRTDAHE
jgi:hypothetical protein